MVLVEIAQLTYHSSCELRNIRSVDPLRLRQFADDLALPRTGHLAVAEECCQNFFMAEALAPRFELFGGLAKCLAKLNQGVAQTVRVEIRQASRLECFPEDFPDRGRVAPVFAL